MPQPIVHVDAFTAVPFAGSPAAVCILPAARDDAWMQQVACGDEPLETAFVVPRGGAAEDFELRWFTPTVEVDLCGHATLASAHVLWETGQVDTAATARFHTRSGLLTAARRGDWIELDFPATPDEAIDCACRAHRGGGRKAALRRPQPVRLPVRARRRDRGHNVRPDFGRLRGFAARGIIVTSRADDAGVDFVSRDFAPAFGIDEGSGHRIDALLPRSVLEPALEQEGVRRAAGIGTRRRLKVALAGDRVRLGGQAVTVLRGELLA